MTIEEAKEIKMAKFLCLNSFEFFCRYFHKETTHTRFIIKDHHRQIGKVAEDIIQGKSKRQIINIAPRFGKTQVAVIYLIAYGLAHNPGAKFIHLSYANDLALDNSEAIRNLIKSDAYQRLFPTVQISRKTDSKKKWYTTAGGGLYATATGGQVTGFGAGTIDDEFSEDQFSREMSDLEQKAGFGGALVIDDPIKPEDANSDIIRKKVNRRFDSTIRNRVNSIKTPILIIGQRLHEEDLCGYVQMMEPGKWDVLSIPCLRPDGTSLWPEKLPVEELLAMQERDPVNFARQYQQKADAIEGKLYKRFKTYQTLPAYLPAIKAVIDTADEGSDYLCSIVYAPTVEGTYLLDVYYTQAGMEVTEQQVAKQQTAYHVQECKVESNAGGRSFARNIERLCREQKNFSTSFIWYHQIKNKNSRIFSQAAEVQNMIIYPEDWESRWPIFARAIKSYLAEGGNAHDDAPDTLTMIIEAQKMDSYVIL